jgi:ATP-dependent Clp protease adaptor protein ClpS
MSEREKTSDQQRKVGLKERDDQRVHKPRLYRVVLHNDDFTPIEFVVSLVVQIFRKSPEEAARITLEVHNSGAAVAGVYTHEIAETKQAVAEATARQYEHPLMVTLEPDA